MMNKSILMAAILLFLLAWIPSEAQQGDIEGTITGQDSGDPLNAVNLMLFQADDLSRPYRTTISGMDGHYSFREVPYGNYVLTASHVGYRRYNESLILGTSTLEHNITLQDQYIDLGEVVVSSLHQQQKIRDVSMPMEVMGSEEIDRLAAFSPSEALAREPGVAMQNDGVWGTSVNIRGMSEQRIVTLVDGNRIETATDLAAGLSMVDMSDLQRIEVIKGAASSIYGTGAMGGVVNFVTKSGHFAEQPYTKGTLSSSYHTVNDMLFRKLALSTGADYGYVRITGMQRNASDIRTPRGVLENSQFEDNNIAVDAGLRPAEGHQLEFQYHRFFARDVGIPGGAPFPGPAKATYPKEKRSLYSLKYSMEDVSPVLNKLSVKYYHQYILRDVRMFPNTPTRHVGNSRITPQKVTPQGKHYTDGLKLTSEWKLSGHQVTAGADLWQRRLRTQRRKFIRKEVFGPQGTPIDTLQIVQGEVPIPDSRFGSAGVFLQDRFSLIDGDLEVTLGGRYDMIRVHNEKALDPLYVTVDGEKNPSPPNQRITFMEQTVYNRSWSADMGLLYALTERLDITLTLGRSFRSPSIEERYKYIDLGSMVRIGDPDLSPEKGYNLDGGIRLWHPDFNMRVNGFVNRFNDLIVEEPGTYVYTYSTGGEAGTQDTLDALINSNVDRALLYGLDMSFDYHLMSDVVWHGTLSFVRGRDIRNDQNLPLIPPLNGQTGIKYHFRGVLTVDLSTRWAADQDQAAPGETHTPGYAIVNLNVFSSPVDLDLARLRLSGGVENIFNKAWQNHLSTNRGVIKTQPGRNVFVKMQLRF
jgi:hemoglobin/transferrin/lactoferrin receptor protein